MSVRVEDPGNSRRNWSLQVHLERDLPGRTVRKADSGAGEIGTTSH